MHLSLTQNFQIKLLPIKFALLSCIALTLGFGVYPLLIPSLVLAIIGFIWIGPQSFVKNLQKNLLKPGCLLFLAILSLFFACYRGFYLPYHPEILVMPWSYFRVLYGLSILTVLWIAFFNHDIGLIEFIWLFCLGSLLFCVITVGMAMWLQKPPFYGSIIDIRYIPLGIRKFINTPGIANLLSLFPATFLAALILKPNQRPRWFWTLGVLGFAISILAALALAQRSYFLLTLIIEPILVALFLLLLKSWRTLIMICALMICYPLIRFLDYEMDTNYLYRPLDQNPFNDARFQMLRYWVEHVIKNPFQRIEVGPAAWSDLQWFHNFFADIHRLSGFWALLTAFILVSYIFLRIICVMGKDLRFGSFLMAVAIPCFLIINTSVVPEGERQPFLLLLAIGAISEVFLSREKVKPKRIPSLKSKL